MRVLVVALLLLSHVGCGSRDPDRREADSDERSPSRTTGSSTGTSGAGGGDGSLEGIRVRAVVHRGGEIEFAVDHRGSGHVGLRSAVTVEQAGAAGFRPVPVDGLTLRADCGTPAPACIPLAAGGGLRPPVWNGRTGGGQCVGPSVGAAVAPGNYRLVVQACEGDASVASEPFTIPR